jgi:hypothetical protein
MVGLTVRACRDCGDLFELLDGEVRFYVQRDLELPRRCKPCRDARRQRAAATPATDSALAPYVSEPR